MLETQFQTQVKIVQSDEGGEFVNTSLKHYFASNGILDRLSCPKTKEQNGLAEHCHRHIVEIGLTLMAHASIPSKFWTVAFTTLVFLINRLPTPILHGKSSYELIFKPPPCYTSL